MKILLTNDDGIHAEGLACLYKELKKIGSVVIVAPDTEKSSVGHGITLYNPLWYKRIYKNKKFWGYAVNGTPADCVKVAVKLILKNKPDIIVSGINPGPNEGCSVFYSGTVAAAREGALFGIPSIAISLASFKNPNFKYSAKLTAKVVKRLIKEQIEKGTFLNINVPNVNEKEIKGIKVTKQCLIPIHTVFRKKKTPGNDNYYWMTGKTPKKKKNLELDTYALNNNYVTITPIHCDSTDYNCFDKINNWNL